MLIINVKAIKALLIIVHLDVINFRFALYFRTFLIINSSLKIPNLHYFNHLD